MRQAAMRKTARWGRAHYEDLAHLIAQHPLRSQLSMAFGRSLSGSNTSFDRSRFINAASDPDYQKRSSAVPVYGDKHYNHVAHVLHDLQLSDQDKASVAAHFANHFSGQSSSARGGFNDRNFFRHVIEGGSTEHPHPTQGYYTTNEEFAQMRGREPRRRSPRTRNYDYYPQRSAPARGEGVEPSGRYTRPPIHTTPSESYDLYSMHYGPEDKDRPIDPVFGRRHQGASSLTQLVQVTDPNNVPTPDADKLPPVVMFPIIPERGGDSDQGRPGVQTYPPGAAYAPAVSNGGSKKPKGGKGKKKAARQRVAHGPDAYSGQAYRYEHRPNNHQELMQHLAREHGVTYSGTKEPADRFLLQLHQQFHDGAQRDRPPSGATPHQHERPGRDPVFGSRHTAVADCPNCHHAAHDGQCKDGDCQCTYSGRHLIHSKKAPRTAPLGMGPPSQQDDHAARAKQLEDDRRLQEAERETREGRPKRVRKNADFMTRPHQSTDDLTPPYNSAQTSPDPWSQNKDPGSADFQAGFRDGQADAQAGRRPTFADNSSRVSPYVSGYAQGYSGGHGRQPRPDMGGHPGSPPARNPDVPRSMGGDSGQGTNDDMAATRFQVSKASRQRRHAIGQTPEPESWEYGSEQHGRTRIGLTENMQNHLVNTHGHSRDAVNGRSYGELKAAHDRLNCQAGRHSPVCANCGAREDQPHGKDCSMGGGNIQPEVLKTSGAFVATASRRDPEFLKGYRYARRWQPGDRLVSRGSAQFEAGLYAGITDSPASQLAWVTIHASMAGRHPVLAQRLERHRSFTAKLAAAGWRTRDNGVYPRQPKAPRPGPRTAATSTDLITDGPGTSPDPSGSTPLNGPGTAPPSGGRSDPARSGGPSPYQTGAQPMGKGPVVTDDEAGRPQEAPQPAGPIGQGFSGPGPGYTNQDQTPAAQHDGPLTPTAPDRAAEPGYSNPDAYDGSPRGGDRVARLRAFQATVQRNLAAANGSRP